VKVVGHDHVVLRVADAERSLAFYSGQLGLVPERLEEWRAGEAPFVSVRVDATTVIDLQEGDRTGVNVDHFALVVEDVDLDELAASGKFDVVRGVGRLWGAQGFGHGLYVADPDGNVVELRTYG
jgi:catechol 2,3-dioxygenase-like lactoylglutathione lyase family enzyme